MPVRFADGRGVAADATLLVATSSSAARNGVRGYRDARSRRTLPPFIRASAHPVRLIDIEVLLALEAEALHRSEDLRVILAIDLDHAQCALVEGPEDRVVDHDQVAGLLRAELHDRGATGR